MENNENKSGTRWWIVALAAYFITVGSAYLTAMSRESRLNEELNLARATIEAISSERDKALESARQWEKRYQDAAVDIEDLKAENEELTRAFEETSFALDEIVYETGWKYLGEFRITHYCNCAKCCGKWANGLTATGTVPTAGKTIAVDPSVIPLGSEVKLNGHIYVAEDTGVYGNSIDVFVDDHQEALQLGLYYAEVKVKQK